MENMRKLKKNKVSGITLIALVVTMIVLLILTGISISMLSSNNGILYQAGNSKEITIKEQNKEELQLAIMELKIENYKNNSFVDFILNCEEYLQSKLNSKDLQIDKDCKKIIYKGNIYSLSDDGNLALENKGIVLSKNHLDLQIMGENHYDKTLGVSKINLDGDVNWKTSNEEIARVEDGKITPISEGEAIITATCIDEKEYKASCKVTVEKFIDDSYIQYDIEYDDTYSGKRYTRNTGWRLITQEQNNDGTYNIEFISTGIPCNLCYGWYEIGKAIWKPTAELKNEYVSRFYDTASRGNSAYAAAGLYYNFDQILFKKEVLNNDYNIGSYRRIITKNQNKIMEELDGEIKGGVFAVKKDAKVRNISLSDIRGYDKIQGKESGGVKAYDSGDEYADKKIGLFKLNDYNLDNNKVKSFFLSNPSSITSFYHILVYMSSGTTNSSNGARTSGLRPIITMQNVNMEKEGCVWIIKD